MTHNYGRPLLLLFAALALFSQTAVASLLAIDYGSDWIKASLMKPGVPFDVLLNKDSKRKFQSSVAWKGDDRLFGTDAANLATRFPSESYSSLKFLQAAPYNSDAVSFFAQVSTAETSETSRGSVALKRKDGSSLAVEELIAMQLAYVKEVAEALAGEKVVDVVLTVPPYYTQPERDAVADAIEIAGLRTLALINDGTAVAVNYAMTRAFKEPEYHVIYDAGASAVRATVASFTTVTAEKTKKESTHIAVAGVGYDRFIGGTELHRRLRDLLLNDFQRKHKRNLRDDERGMARLWKEAGRVKSILSANAESRVVVESIAWDIDYKSKISRDQFEKACADIKPRFAQPILDAVAAAGLTLDQITSVILFGGASRTPMVKAAVTAAVGEAKVAVNVNADEAAVLGAALHGASLSRSFRTKDIRVSDIATHDVHASYPAEKSSKTISTPIFVAGSKTGTRKTMTFKRKDDFAITLAYKQPPAPGFPTQLLEAHITGVAEALKNLTSMGAADPVIKATLTLSESGFVSVKEAFAVGEIKDDSFTGKLKNLFSGNGDSASSSASGSSSSSSSSAADASASASKKEEEKKPEPKEEKLPLTIEVKFLSVPPMSVEEKKAARDHLLAIDYAESGKRHKEDARNALESYLYRVRDLLEDESESAPFRKCSKNSERTAISQKLDETFTWMNDAADDADAHLLVEKRVNLESLERPIVYRYKEIEEFPQALNMSQMWNWSTRLFLTEAKTNLTAEEAEGLPLKYTAKELADLEAALKEHETWLNIGVEAQKKLQFHDDRAIQSSEMKKRAEELAMKLQKLMKRKAPKVKKTSTSSTASSTTAAGTDNSETLQSSPTASTKVKDEL